MPNKPIHRYVDGTSYRSPGGRIRQRERNLASGCHDVREWKRELSVVDLDEDPVAGVFYEKIGRELRIRCYSQRSIKVYMLALRCFLDWVGIAPRLVVREHVREYLDVLASANAAPNTLALHLSAIRTAFDKFCFRDVTLGLVSPRKRRRVPVVLSREEVRRMLGSGLSQRDKLLIGLMYATGMRVGEVVRIKVNDIDIDRSCLVVRMGKGNCDREVTLPDKYRQLFADWTEWSRRDAYLFPSACGSKHLSPRTVQRVVRQAACLANIAKTVTPHSLRHSYATHCFENGYDIRHIQKVLGHVRLETTTIYVKVSQRDGKCQLRSPIDDICSQNLHGDQPKLAAGRLRIHQRAGRDENEFRITLEVVNNGSGQRVFLTGIVARQIHDQFWSVEFPQASSWTEAKKLLNDAQRERIESPEFYFLIQRELSQRLSKGSQVALAG